MLRKTRRRRTAGLKPLRKNAAARVIWRAWSRYLFRRKYAYHLDNTSLAYFKLYEFNVIKSQSVVRRWLVKHRMKKRNVRLQLWYRIDNKTFKKWKSNTKHKMQLGICLKQTEFCKL